MILTTCTSRYKTEETFQLKGKGYLLVKRFYHLLEENNRNNLSLKEYANLLAVTPNHLTQTVKQYSGKTSSQIIKAKRVLEIKRLLVHTSLSVSEIAHQLHFEDPSYFTKFFKREAGFSPLQYRNEAAR